MKRFYRRADAVLDLIYPRRCPFCNRILGSLPDCPDCRQAVRKLWHEPPRLAPTEHSLSGLAGAASACYYKGEVAKAIRLCKFGGRPWYGWELARLLMSRVFGYTFERRHGIIIPTGQGDYRMDYDLVVPVPHSGGQRGYNVPALLARQISRATGIPLSERTLAKIRKTPPQASLDRQRRLTNLVGAFEARQGLAEDKRILLVDDVITTGATVTACTAALLKGGAASVFAVSVAAAEE